MNGLLHRARWILGGLAVVAMALGWLAWTRPPSEPPAWMWTALAPWLLGGAVLGMASLWVRGARDRSRLFAAACVGAGVVATIQAGWIQHARQSLLGQSADSPGGAALDSSGTVEADRGLDVLVVGGGPAGMSAAIEAISKGASVLVVDRDEEPGGAARWSGGQMLFSGTSEQASSGVVDGPARLLADWPGLTGGDPEDPWVRAFAESNVQDVRDWLANLGAGFTLMIPETDEGVSRVHQIQGGGIGLVNVLAGALPRSVWRLSTRV
ncbi:MAG: FAD-dependent oxidoreductase, partial [Myxococcota bacterium]|nr:FAD-dependent oxidoreductase [Myxococcota bacterium]